jgi:hypothetical protein
VTPAEEGRRAEFQTAARRIAAGGADVADRLAGLAAQAWDNGRSAGLAARPGTGVRDQVIAVLRARLCAAAFDAGHQRTQARRQAGYAAAFATARALDTVLAALGAPAEPVQPGDVPGELPLRAEQITTARRWLGPAEADRLLGPQTPNGG